jgi:plastocyanin/mono/diheme cytochrome c family protein
MTDQTPSTPAPVPDGTGTPPPDDAQERLPATIPQQSMTADRFNATPSVKATAGLTPQRSAGIVRQSAAARWVGFLTVIFVSLFIVGYWFYELGAPAGISTSRLVTEIEQQQVTAIERGYNLYEANCARCHGPQGLGPNEPDAAAKATAGQGYIGPQLNAQEKLFAHLSEAYLENVLLVGGRYVCGNPKSAMPVWSDQANPPGPLNYRQIEELIAFLRATSDKHYEMRDPSTNEPIIDPATGEPKTFTGWRDPNYKPAPGATPFPDCYLNALAGGPGGSAAPGASIDPNAPKVTVAAKDGAASSGFEPNTLEAKADTAFTLVFENDDTTSGPHNVVISDSANAVVPIGDTAFFTGPSTKSYAVPALKAGSYGFVCQVHPTTMTGKLEVK